MYAVNYFWKLFKKALLFNMFLTFNLHSTVSVEYSTVPFESVSTSTEGTELDRCASNVTSCSYQIPLAGVSEESCSLVKYDKTSKDCSYSFFKEGKMDEDEEFGSVVLFPYVLYHNYAYMAFNVTFFNSKWKCLRFRFYESGSTQPDICREFKLSEEVTPIAAFNVSLFYDCLWTHKDIESKTYHFQYIAYPYSDSPPISHQFVFFVPNVLNLGTFKCCDSKLPYDSEKSGVAKSQKGVKCYQCPPFRQEIEPKKLELFLSVDVSVLPKLRLHVQTAHSMYNITRYRVQLTRSLVDDRWSVVDKIITVLPNQTYFSFTHDTKYRPGVYNFTVTPLHVSCHNEECRVTKAPGIVIVASTTEYLIGMVSAVLLIPILIAIYFLWRRNRQPYPEPGGAMQPPKVLLVYNPDYKSHVSDMIRFCEYLKGCHVKPMLDIFCIPTSPSQNPMIWYREAFDLADFVLVFAPPPATVKQELHVMITYPFLQRESHNQFVVFLTRHRITRVRCFFRDFLKLEGNKQVFSVRLPGCDWNGLYREAKYFKKFSLPEDIDKLLRKLNVSIPKSQVSNLGKQLKARFSPMQIDNWLKLIPIDREYNKVTIDIEKGQKSDFDPSDSDEDEFYQRINWRGDNNHYENNTNEESRLNNRADSCDSVIDFDEIKL